MSLKIVVTGGAGFIGSALVRQLIAETDATVINVVGLTDAGNLEISHGESLPEAGADAMTAAKPETASKYGRVLCVTSNFPRWNGDSTTPFGDI